MKKSILVTGASKGIGAAVAIDLAAAGFYVGCMSRSGACPSFDDSVRNLESDLGQYLVPIKGDVTESSSFTEAVQLLVNRTGPLVGVVNNAGIHTDGKSSDLASEAFSETMDANALSVLLGCQAAYPELLKHGGGLLINVGSFFDKIGVKRNLAYCASKAAVGAISRVLAVEWAGDGIRVVNVAPGYIVTNLNHEFMSKGPLKAYLEKRIPAGKPGTAKDVATLIAGLFTMDCQFLTGETIYIDGAQGIAH